MLNPLSARRRALVPVMVAVIWLAGCGPSSPTTDQAASTAPLTTTAATNNTGDASNGRRLFVQCQSCHSLAADGPVLLGPNLHGLFGREAGSQRDFSYSVAMQEADFVWDEAQLDRFLTRPGDLVPGTIMIFAGVPDPDMRRDIIAYLREATSAD